MFARGSVWDALAVRGVRAEFVGGDTAVLDNATGYLHVYYVVVQLNVLTIAIDSNREWTLRLDHINKNTL